MPWLLYPRGKTPVFIEQVAGGVPESVQMFWRREKSVAPAGNQTTIPQLSNP
jgi:hypothetical protein